MRHTAAGACLGVAVKRSCFFLGSVFLFSLSFNTILTLFTTDSKYNTGSTREDEPRKIPGANACGQKDEKALQEWWKYVSSIPAAWYQCLGHKFDSMRILKMWFWKQRTSKYLTKERDFFEVKCRSHTRLKIKITPIHYCFSGGTHQITHPLEQDKQHVIFPQAATLQKSPLGQVAVLFLLLTKGSG